MSTISTSMGGKKDKEKGEDDCSLDIEKRKNESVTRTPERSPGTSSNVAIITGKSDLKKKVHWTD